jgi:hypothetical protein
VIGILAAHGLQQLRMIRRKEYGSTINDRWIFAPAKDITRHGRTLRIYVDDIHGNDAHLRVGPSPQRLPKVK